MPPRERGQYLANVWRVILILALVSMNFTIGCMLCLHYFSFSIMAGKGYFMILDIAEYKAFRTLFC